MSGIGEVYRGHEAIVGSGANEGQAPHYFVTTFVRRSLNVALENRRRVNALILVLRVGAPGTWPGRSAPSKTQNSGNTKKSRRVAADHHTHTPCLFFRGHH